jgi:hypothetical protein
VLFPNLHIYLDVFASNPSVPTPNPERSFLLLPFFFWKKCEFCPWSSTQDEIAAEAVTSFMFSSMPKNLIGHTGVGLQAHRSTG